jgi:hypothetical protein
LLNISTLKRRRRKPKRRRRRLERGRRRRPTRRRWRAKAPMMSGLEGSSPQRPLPPPD